MYQVSGKIRSFTDLKAWQESHKLVIMIYQQTKKFPREELFGLTNQIRRAAVSMTSNIAEGFGRKSRKEKIQFFLTAQSSVTEVQSQLLVARDVGYMAKDDFQALADQSIKVHKLVGGLIKHLRSGNDT